MNKEQREFLQAKYRTVLIWSTAIFGILSLLALLYVDSVNRKKQKEALISQVVEVVPIDFGHNVYEFPFTGDNFRREVSKFLDKHPDLEVVASDSDVDAMYYGRQIGHTVFFRKKQN